MSPLHPKFFPQHTICKTLTAPAKAILFGEYGVLYGGPAVVLTFAKYRFTIEFSLTPKKNSEERTRVHVISNFFTHGEVSFECGSNVTGEALFFANVLKPWEAALKQHHVRIVVQESYESKLGFGSSSAILALVYHFLWTCFFPQEPMQSSVEFAGLVRQGLGFMQQGGSAYDVFCQLAAMNLNVKNQLWVYSMASGPRALNVSLELLQKFGSFVQTSVYSNTAIALKKFSQNERKEHFAQEHRTIAEKFLQNIAFENVAECMQSSCALARAQGLFLPEDLCHEKFNNILSADDFAGGARSAVCFSAHKRQATNHKVICAEYKTMGAGHGDCLWVLADKKTLIEQYGIDPSEIAFAFEELP